jgi:hypothetical protein
LAPLGRGRKNGDDIPNAHPTHVAAIGRTDDACIAARVMEYRRSLAIGDGLSGHTMLYSSLNAEDDAGTTTIVISASVEGDGDDDVVVVVGTVGTVDAAGGGGGGGGGRRRRGGGGTTIVDSLQWRSRVETDDTKEEDEEQGDVRDRAAIATKITTIATSKITTEITCAAPSSRIGGGDDHWAATSS